MRVWRICPRDESAQAFEGSTDEGRWNEPGVPFVYASASRALATLEFVVHLDSKPVPDLVAISGEVPEDVTVSTVDEHELPPGWRRPEGHAELRRRGTEWARAARSAVLSVPSAVVSGDRNYLLNPCHPDFARIAVLEPEAFQLDPRLREAAATGERSRSPAGAEVMPTGPPAPIADDSVRRLGPQFVAFERLTGAIASAVVALLLLSGVAIGSVAARLPWVAIAGAGCAWLLVVGGLAWLTWAMPALRYRHTSYRVNERGIEIRRGAFWRQVVTVPRSRVQHTDVSEGPLQRGYGLATLVIHTAGTEHASVRLEGIEASVASSIRDFLIAGTGQDAV